MTEVFEHGYAIVVGVDDNNIKRLALPTVAKDVEAIYEVLIHPERCAYKEENVKLLKGSESTRVNIIEALEWLDEKVEDDPKATAVIYYSGHGMEDKRTDKYYLIPYDIKNLKKVKSYAIDATNLTDTIQNITAQRLLVMLDCCHAAGMDIKNVDQESLNEDDEEEKIVTRTSFPLDSFAETKDIPDYEGEPGVSKDVGLLEEGEGRAILNSSTDSQSSYIRNDNAMSIFTYHLIEALTGHIPHRQDDAVVLVTDVMSWVTREVAKSARQENRKQTPVMRTSGVFPVAQLIGGQGVSKGLGGVAPDPLAPLPDIQIGDVGGSAFVGDVNAGGHVAGGNIETTEIHQEGQIVQGPQITTGDNAQFGQIGNNINTSGGTYVGGDQNIQGDVVHGDKFGGDKVEGDKVMGDKNTGDSISVGNISGSTGIAIGREASANVTTNNYQVSKSEIAKLFAPLQSEVTKANSGLVSKVNELKSEIQTDSQANDNIVAGLVDDIAKGAPSAIPYLKTLFQNPDVLAASGPMTQFILSRL